MTISNHIILPMMLCVVMVPGACGSSKGECALSGAGLGVAGAMADEDDINLD